MGAGCRLEAPVAEGDPSVFPMGETRVASCDEWNRINRYAWSNRPNLTNSLLSIKLLILIALKRKWKEQR